MIRLAGGRPLAGLSTARGLAALRVYLVFLVNVHYYISNIIFKHCPPDRGIDLVFAGVRSGDGASHAGAANVEGLLVQTWIT
jgi:hypothetical protein